MTEREPKRTSAKPITIDGVTFACWSVGIMATEWRSEDGRARVARPHMRPTFWATVDRKSIGTRFQSHRTAMAAAAKALKQSEAK